MKYLGDAATFNLLIPLETGHLYQPANSNAIFKASFLQVYILSSAAATPAECNLSK